MATLVMGVSLTVWPSPTARVIGLGGSTALARSIGLADLVLAPWLLLDRGRRSSAMAVRAALNVAIGLAYAVEAHRNADRRAEVGAAAMAVLTVVDAAVARALRPSEGVKAR